MDGMLLAVAVVFLLPMACFGILFARLIKVNRQCPLFSNDDQSIFCPERYQEMELLLDARLSHHQRGSTLEIRNEQAKLLRTYIDELSRDFHIICSALKAIIVNSPVDRPDLARVLATQRLLFGFTIFTVRLKLILYRLGWSSLGIDSMTESLRLLSAQLRSLAAFARLEAACY